MLWFLRLAGRSRAVRRAASWAGPTLPHRPASLRAAATLLAVLAIPASSPAATITIVNLDTAGVGLNDPTGVAPVGGNTGTTKGAQALIVFQKAAEIWGTKLVSNVEIKVDSRFAPLTCTTSSGTLGSAGPGSFWMDFTNAPVANTIYPQALANALSGVDVDPVKNDINMQFNGGIGTATCLSGLSWYMGLDGNAPSGTISLLSVTLHEMAHGFGFLSLVSLSTGAKASGLDDAFMRKLESHTLAQQFPAITDSQRLAAMTSVTALHWTGTAVLSANGSLTAGTSGGHLLMYAPNPSVSGSSVSHFDKTLTPSDLMEPSYTSAILDVSRALLLLKDIGWNTCGNGSVEFGEQCDDGNASSADCCSSACTFSSSAVVCRASAGVCDPAETCTGSSGSCPADAFASAATVCRASAGACDAAENCSGASASCPADSFASASTVCRASAGACDPAENCSGSAVACPANTLSSAGTACASDGQPCTTDQCNGASASCQHVANSLPCDDGLFCDGLDTCSGGTCSLHAGNPCSGPDGDANCAESCDEGANACTGADPNGSACSDGDACTTGDQCSGGTCSGQPASEGPCATTTTTLPAALCGDANDNGQITSSDALLALKAAVGTSTCSLLLCDYSGDGKLTATDALAILRVAVGQTVTPKCPASLPAPMGDATADTLQATTTSTDPATSTTMGGAD